MFRDIDRCEAVIDNLLIWGETDEQHDKSFGKSKKAKSQA